MNTDHIVLAHNECVCNHCGQRYAISMPVPLSIFDAIVNTFLKGHAKCKKVQA